MSNNGTNGHGKINFALKRRVMTVAVDELETSFTLRALSHGQLERLKDDQNTTTNLIAASIVNPETLEPMYTADELAEMSISVSKILSDAVGELNGFSKEAIEAATKKSIASQSTASDSV